MELMMQIAILFALLNSVILCVLLYFYGRMAFKTKASYSLGLLIFAAFLLAQNVLTVYSYFDMWHFFGTAALPYLSWMAGLEFIALIALIRITI
jgi:hypothetical protein